MSIRRHPPGPGPARRLDRNASALAWPGGLVTVGGVLHLLGEGQPPEEIERLFPGLPDRWLAQVAAAAAPAVAAADAVEFGVDAELAGLVGAERIETIVSVAGSGHDPVVLAAALAERITALPRPLIVGIEGAEEGRDHLYGQLIHTHHGVVAEVVGNAYLPAGEALSGTAVKVALAMGWNAPDPSGGDPNFWRDDLGEGHLANVVWRILSTLSKAHGVEVWEPLRVTMTPTEIHYEIFDTGSGPRIRPAVPRE